MMNGVSQIREHLLEELELCVRTVETLLTKVAEEEWSYRPAENMRSLFELVHHLISIPITDLAILQERSQEEVVEVEERYVHLKNPDDIAVQYRSNYEVLRNYMLGLTEDELLHKATKAFYLEHSTLQIKWLIEIVTHSYHHRSQLYNYLKQSGHDLHFSLLYGG